MHKIVLGLTPEALEQMNADLYKYCSAIKCLIQHKVLISDTILDEYNDYFSKNDNIQLFRQWFSEWDRYDRIEFSDKVENSFDEEIVLQISRLPHKLVIYNKNRIDSKGYAINQLSLDTINDSDMVNELSLYCLPLTWFVPEGTPMDEIKNWFSNVFSGEEYINIIDRYIVSNGEKAKLLGKYYIPTMSSAKKIRVYYGEYDGDQVNAISPLKSQFQNRIELKKYNPQKAHDRYIFNKSITISIGAGLDFVDIKTGRTRVGTTISAVKGQQVKCPS